MNSIKNILISGLCLLSLTGCDLIDYHPMPKSMGRNISMRKTLSALNVARRDGRKSVSP